MKSVVRMARWASEELEQLPVGVGAWCALFIGIVLVRDLIEGFSGSLPLVHPVDFFLHYPLAFINPLLTLAILLSIGSGVSLARVTRIMLVMWSLVLIPPVVDLIIGAVGPETSKAHIGYAPLFRGEYLDRFLHFFNPTRSFPGTTAGIRVEAFLEVVLALAYVVLKRRRIGPGLVWGGATALVVYVVSLGYFTWPFHIYNLVTPADEASLNGLRHFIVDYGMVAREHFDRFSHASGAMHALLLPWLCLAWFWRYRPRAFVGLVRSTGAAAALAGLLALGGLAFGAARFVLGSGVAFEPSVIDRVFMANGVVAAMAAVLPMGLLSGRAQAAGLSAEERLGALVATIAVCMINAWMVSYAVFTLVMVVLAISILRTVAPFKLDRVPMAAQAIAGMQSVCLILVTVAVFARAQTIQLLPHRLVLAALLAATLAACHGAGRGAVARRLDDRDWIEAWVRTMPAWRESARALLEAIVSLGRTIRPCLPWLPLAAPWVLWAAYPGATLLPALIATAAYALSILWRFTRGAPAAAILGVFGLTTAAMLGRDPRVLEEQATETPLVRAELQLGLRLLWSDHVELALEQFARVIELGPQTFQVFQNSIGVRNNLLDQEGALRDAQRAVEVLPEDARAWSSLGDAQSLTGNYEAALQAYDYALALDPADLDLLRNAAIAAGLEHDSRTTLHYMQLGLAAAPDDALFQAGVLSAELALYANAAPDSLSTYLARARTSQGAARREALLHTAAAQLADGDAAAAAATYRELTTADPSDPLPWLLGGQAEGIAGEADRALRSLDRFIALRPGFAPGFAARSRVHQTQGAAAAAIRDLEAAIARDARDPVLHFQLAGLRLQAGDPDAAWVGLKRLPKTWPTPARRRALDELLRQHFRGIAQRRDGAAIEGVPQQLRAAGLGDATILCAVARALVEVRAILVAGAVLELAREIAPDDPLPAIQFAQLLLSGGRGEEAATALRAAIDAGAGDRPRVFALLATAYEQAGRPDLAAVARRRELELKAETPPGSGK